MKSSDRVLCPYCGSEMHWRWTIGALAQSRSVFECQTCGEFPDFRKAREANERSETELVPDRKIVGR